MANREGLTVRQAAFIAGLGYLFNPVPFAEFFIYPKLVIGGHIDQTVANISSHPGLFLAGAWRSSCVASHWNHSKVLNPRDIETLGQIAGNYRGLRRYADEKTMLARILAVFPNDTLTKVALAGVEFDSKWVLFDPNELQIDAR